MIYYILFNQNLTFKEAVIYVLITMFVFLVSLTIHEFAHSFVAYKMGDPTPKQMGRLTLNPFKHLSGSGFLCFILFGIGWANPVPINPLNFKKYKTGTRLVSIAGVLSNFILGLIAAIIYAILLATVGFSSVAMEYVFLILEYFMLVNSYLAIFNLLPIYPLDGFNFITSFMKSDNKFIKYGVQNGFRILFMILMICLFIELFFGFDLLDWVFSLFYNYIYVPIAMLGV